MNPRHKELVDYLDAYFAGRRTPDEPFHSDRSRAEHLQMSTTQYSRLISGKTHLTKQMAMRMAMAMVGKDQNYKPILEELMDFVTDPHMHQLPSPELLRDLIEHHTAEIARHEKLRAAARELLDANVNLPAVTEALRTLGYTIV